MNATLEQAVETPILVTAEEILLHSGEGRFELIEGEIKQMAPASAGHGATAMSLAGRLFHYVQTKTLGTVFAAETGFKIATNPDTVRAPDAAFVRAERLTGVNMERDYFPGAPDLAVEVVSPGDRVFEVDEKVEMWLEAGTLQVWVVNPRRRVVTIYERDGQSHTLRADQDLDGGTLLPGFLLRIGEIFPSP